MAKRVYEERGGFIIHRLELDDDGSFVYTEEEDRIHGDGASASGRWEEATSSLSLRVTKSSFQKEWLEEMTEHATLDGDTVIVRNVTLRASAPRGR